MHGQHGMRRLVLAALVMMVALVHAGSEAEGSQGHPRPDFGGKSGFKLECELLGGTFSEDGIGNTNCHYPDGTWTQCDANGNDCWVTPPRTRPPSETIDDTPDEATTDTGRPSVAGPETVGPTLAAADRDQDRAKNKSKHAKGKNRKHKK